MGHTRWETATPLPDKRALEIQLACIDWYILALEDVLEDLADTRAKWLDSWDNSSNGLVPDEVVKAVHVFLDSAFTDIRKQAGAHRESAIATRKTFKEIYNGQDAQAALGDDVRGDLG